MTLREALQPGRKIKVFIAPGNHNNATWHIRAIMDEDYIVYRVWSPSKGWQYQMDWIGRPWLWAQQGWLLVNGRKVEAGPNPAGCSAD